MRATLLLHGSTGLEDLAQLDGEVSDVVNQLPSDLLDASATLEFRFDGVPDSTTRVELRNHLQAALAKEYDQEEHMSAGWEERPRVLIDDELGPHFAVATDRGTYRVGVWASSHSFILCWVSDVDLASTWFDVKHWHPDSRASGSWRDQIGELVSGLTCAHSYKDEDGAYFDVAPTPASPEGVAATIAEFASSIELFGAESFLLPMLLQTFECQGSLYDIYIDMFPDAQNSGYELSSCSIRVPVDVAEALRARGCADVTPELAVAWLAQIHKYRYEVCTDDKHGGDLSNLMAYLHQTADRK